MRENEVHNGERCTYCGRFRDLDDDICDCGKGIGYTRDWGGDYYFGDLNCIDNILEMKRVR